MLACRIIANQLFQLVDCLSVGELIRVDSRHHAVALLDFHYAIVFYKLGLNLRQGGRRLMARSQELDMLRRHRMWLQHFLRAALAWNCLVSRLMVQSLRHSAGPVTLGTPLRLRLSNHF